MVNLSRTCNDVVFLLVLGDESEEMTEFFKREKIEKVPHFNFYKSMEKIHEEEGIGPDRLAGDVLYYGDSHSGVVQLHNRDDVEKLIADHKEDKKTHSARRRPQTLWSLRKGIPDRGETIETNGYSGFCTHEW